MSKSDASAQSRIELTDDADIIAQKIKRAKTDTGVIPASASELTGRPEAKNLVSIYAALAGMSVQQVLDLHQGQGFGPFKTALTEVVVNEIAPIALKTGQLLQDESYLVQMLHNGAQRAQAIAEPIVSEAEKLVGFIRQF